MTNKTKGFLALLASGITFGSFGIWVRLLSSELTSYQQIVFRNLFALSFTVLIIILKKINWKEIRTINRHKLISFAFVVPISVILYVFAVTNEKIAVVTFAFYGGTIITSWLLGMLFLKEKPDKLGWVSLLLVFIGLIVMNYPMSFTSLSFGFVLAFLSGATDGLANYLRKSLGGNLNKFLLVLLTAIGGVLVSGFMILLSGNNLLFMTDLPTNVWLTGILFGGLLILVNFLLLYGFQHFDVSLGSIVLSTELFFATFFAVIVFREVPSLFEIIGGILILVGVVVPNIQLLFRRKYKNR